MSALRQRVDLELVMPVRSGDQVAVENRQVQLRHARLVVQRQQRPIHAHHSKIIEVDVVTAGDQKVVAAIVRSIDPSDFVGSFNSWRGSVGS